MIRGWPVYGYLFYNILELPKLARKRKMKFFQQWMLLEFFCQLYRCVCVCVYIFWLPWCVLSRFLLKHSSAVLLEEISSLLKTPPFATPTLKSSSSYLMYHSREGCLLNLAHSFWQHSSVYVLTLLTRLGRQHINCHHLFLFYSWMQSSIKPIVTNEVQLLYLCHLFGPIIGRLKNDRPTSLLEVSHCSALWLNNSCFQVFSEVYQCIQKVDKHQEGKLSNSEPLCDLLYPPCIVCYSVLCTMTYSVVLRQICKKRVGIFSSLIRLHLLLNYLHSQCKYSTHFGT